MNYTEDIRFLCEPEEENKNIIYGLIDPRTNDIRYVGQSSKGLSRTKEHKTPSKLKKDRTYKGNWIRQLIECKVTYNCIILEKLNTSCLLNERECYWIKHGKSNNWKLTNLTDGGEGIRGHKFTDEHRRKISEAKKKYRFTDEHIANLAKISIFQKGRNLFPEHLKKLHKSKLGTNQTKETKLKISMANKGRIPKKHIIDASIEKNSKPIIDLNSGFIYKSPTVAAKVLRISRTIIYSIVSGRIKFSRTGYKFKYLKDYKSDSIDLDT